MYKALKPFSMSGKGYLVNDEVDVSKINENQIASLIKKRYIVETNPAKEREDAPQVCSIDVPIYDKDKVINISLSAEQVVEALTVIQQTVEKAEEIISTIDSDDLLVLIHKITTTKGIKEAAKKRADKLAEEREAQAKANENSDPNAGNNDKDNEPDPSGSGEE